jgi:NAD(P)-dependent dehydrogenase (short-subunit alcohol dehydrogenase family)
VNGRFLAGRVAVLSGAARGIGQAMAWALGDAGAGLALVDRDPPTETLAEARRRGHDAEAYVADVTDEARVAGLAEEVGGRFGPVHILVNSAGVAVRKPVLDLTLAEWRHVLETNVTGPFLMCRAFVPAMKGQGYGRVINLTSIMSHVATAERSVYAASKAALLAFTKSLALELAADGITVVAVSPGFFATDLTAGLRADPRRSAELLDRIPMRRWGEPRDLGPLAIFLCSDAAAYMTGSDVVIDGGWLAQ